MRMLIYLKNHANSYFLRTKAKVKFVNCATLQTVILYTLQLKALFCNN